MTYYPSVLQRLGTSQCQKIVHSLQGLFADSNPVAGGVSSWSLVVQGNGNNPLGTFFVCRNSIVEEVGEVQEVGAFAKQ